MGWTAWALRRLTERYDDPTIQALSVRSRSRLHALLHDHLAALRAIAVEFSDRFQMLLDRAPHEPVGPTEEGNWHAGIEHVFAEVDSLDRLTVRFSPEALCLPKRTAAM